VQAVRHSVTSMRALRAGSPERARLERVVRFYGRYGEKNGVTVTVGSGTLPGAVGGATTDASGTTIGVQLQGIAFAAGGPLDGMRARPEFALELSSVLTHEGQHGIDQQAVGMATTRTAVLAGEIEAYTTQAYQNQGLGYESSKHVWTESRGIDFVRIHGNAKSGADEWCLYARVSIGAASGCDQ
jgi:hypothetical protein